MYVRMCIILLFVIVIATYIQIILTITKYTELNKIVRYLITCTSEQVPAKANDD
jgi:hypothetical protein